MKYENTKNKIRKLWINSSNIEYQIEDEQHLSEIINSNLTGLILPSNNFKKVISIVTEWENMDSLLSISTTMPFQSKWRFYSFAKEWNINLGQIPLNLIPYILIAFEFKYEETENRYLEIDNTSIFYEIAGEPEYLQNLDEISIFNHIKNSHEVILHSLLQLYEAWNSDAISGFYEAPVIQTRLHINIINPNNYV